MRARERKREREGGRGEEDKGEERMKRDKQCADREMFFCFIAIGFLYVLICQSGSKRSSMTSVMDWSIYIVEGRLTSGET